MAIKIAVTTWPRPRSLNAPNADIGATGCNTIIPYKIKSHSVSVRRSLGAAAVTVEASVPKPLSFQLSPCPIQSFQAPSFCGNPLRGASANFPLPKLPIASMRYQPSAMRVRPDKPVAEIDPSPRGRNFQLFAHKKKLAAFNFARCTCTFGQLYYRTVNFRSGYLLVRVHS